MLQGLKTIIKKELADHFSSYRFTILFALIAMVSLITAYRAGLNIRQELEGVAAPQFIFLMLFTRIGVLFSLVQFVAFLGPLVGLVLGFDTINRERNEGTLSKLLSQPIYRDVVINGKFLAGVVMITNHNPTLLVEFDFFHEFLKFTYVPVSSLFELLKVINSISKLLIFCTQVDKDIL